MKKRLLCLFMAGAMSVSFAACAQQKEAAVATEEKASEEPVKVEETETAASETEETTEAPKETEETEEAAAENEVPEGVPLFCELTKNYFEVTDDGTLLVKGFCSVPGLSGKSAELFPELDAALKKDGETLIADYSATMETYIESAREEYRNAPERFTDGNMHYASESNVLMQRADEKVTSYFSYGYDYTGGAHGMYGQTGYTYDNRTGERLLLTDVFSDTSGLAGILKDELEATYPDVVFDDLDNALSYYDVSLTEAVPEDDNDMGYHYPYQWALSGEGVEFYFGPYSLAAYAAGDQKITLSYEKYADIMKPDYLPNEGSSYMVSFKNFLSGYDVNGDGASDQISVDFGYSDDYTYIESISLMVGEKSSESLPYNGDGEEADVDGYYIVMGDGRKYVYLLANELNDYQELFVYDVTSGSPVSVGSKGFHRSVFDYGEDGSYAEFLLSDPENLPISSHFDYLSSFTAFRCYHPGEDGMPVSEDPYFVVLSDAAQEALVAKTEVDCILVTEDGEETGETKMIQKGDTFAAYRTDGEIFLDVKFSDGSIGRLTITDNGYPCEINGIKDTDFVETTWYAG